MRFSSYTRKDDTRKRTHIYGRTTDLSLFSVQMHTPPTHHHLPPSSLRRRRTGGVGQRSQVVGAVAAARGPLLLVPQLRVQTVPGQQLVVLQQ